MSTATLPSPLLRRKQPYPWAWLVGLVLHLAVAGVAVVASLRREPPRIDLAQKPIEARLVQLGKPQEKPLLPRKETAPPPPPAPERAPVVIPDRPAPSPEARAPAPPTPAERPAAPKPPDDSKKRLDDVMRKFAATAAVARPDEPRGVAGEGPSGKDLLAEGDAYWALVKGQIESRYTVPATIPDQERLHLKATLRIWIGRGGEITRHQLVTPSGNPLFDSALEGAVVRVGRLPPPPGHLAGTLGEKGVDLVFRATGR